MKRIETPETLGGGRIVLTEGTRQELTSQQMEVVDTGAWDFCPHADCERPHDSFGCHPIAGLARGQWVLLAPRSLTETDVDGLYCCHQDDVLAILTVENQLL